MPEPDATSRGGQGSELESALEQLAQLLQSELDTLVHEHDAARIEQIAARKVELCARIEAFGQPAQGDDAQALRLRELARQVAQANQRNGAVVAALMRNTRGALDLLRAAPGTEAAEVYGPGGRSLGSGPARPLGSA